MNPKNAWYVCVAVVFLLSFYYFVLMGRPVSPNFINAIVAFSATFVIGFSFVLGSVCRLFPPLNPLLVLRKNFGLIGFGLAALHVVLVVPVQLAGTREITLGDAASLAFAAIAFMIFTLMALTSTVEWMEKLGYNNWKNLQRIGYIAFAFVLFHILLLERGIFLSRATGQIAIAFILIALLLRAILLVFFEKNKEKITV